MPSQARHKSVSPEESSGSRNVAPRRKGQTISVAGKFEPLLSRVAKANSLFFREIFVDRLLARRGREQGENDHAQRGAEDHGDNRHVTAQSIRAGIPETHVARGGSTGKNDMIANFPDDVHLHGGGCGKRTFRGWRVYGSDCVCVVRGATAIGWGRPAG